MSSSQVGPTSNDPPQAGPTSNDPPQDAPVWPVPADSSGPMPDSASAPMPASASGPMPDAPTTAAPSDAPAAIPAAGMARPAGTAPSVGSAGQRTWTVFSQTVWDGTWLVPQRLVVSVACGEVRLDLRQAQFTATETEIEVLGLMGEVKIVVPETHRVECRGSAILGEFRAKESGAPEPAAAEAPVLWVTGSMALGEVTVYRTDAAPGEGAFGVDGMRGWRHRRRLRGAG